MGWWDDLISNPTLSKSRMQAKDNGKRKGDWLQPAAEWVSDAIPNEFSKLNNPWTGNIPYVGWFLKGMAAADNFSETYANTGDVMASAQHGGKGIMGTASDPYAYSPKNQPGLSPDWEKDWAGNIGKGMNIAGAYKSGNYGSALNGVVGMFSKYDENNKGYYPMTGVGVGSDQDPNMSKSSGIGGMGGGMGGLDLGGVMNMFGSKSGGQQNDDSQLMMLMLKYLLSSDEDFSVGEKSAQAPTMNAPRISFAPSYAY
jgi:hypothetical protein